ncbi:hypothetical protein EVAR_66522_1, partial [Eumeta japonica]
VYSLITQTKSASQTSVYAANGADRAAFGDASSPRAPRPRPTWNPSARFECTVFPNTIIFAYVGDDDLIKSVTSRREGIFGLNRDYAQIDL